ncbi:MAG: orotate phosphoribosyltransferase [Nitrososphaeraceae archaeon]
MIGMKVGEEIPFSKRGRYAELFGFIKNNAIVFEHVRLYSNVESDYYYDLRRVSLHPKGINLVVDPLLEQVKKFDVKSVGGLANAAIPLSTALVIKDSNRGEYENALTSFYVREVRKDHGLMKQIEGMIKDPVVIVDDVLTSGNSIKKAIDAVEGHGYRVSGVVCILDREETRVRNVLKENGIKYTSLFKHSEFKPFIEQKLNEKAKRE